MHVDPPPGVFFGVIWLTVPVGCPEVRCCVKLSVMAIWLSEADVRAVLPMARLVDAIEAAVVAFSAGKGTQPVRTVLETPGGFFASMPAFLGSTPGMGAKLVTVCHGNPNQGLPTHLARITLLNPTTVDLFA